MAAQALEGEIAGVGRLGTGKDTREHSAVGSRQHSPESSSADRVTGLECRSLPTAESKPKAPEIVSKKSSAFELLMQSSKSNMQRISPRDTLGKSSASSLEVSRLKLRKMQSTDRAIALLVEDFLYKYMPVPASSLRTLHQWNDDEDLRYIPAHSKAVTDGVDRYCRALASSTLKSRYDLMTAETSCPVWSAKHGKVEAYYESLEDSTIILHDLLLFQLGSESALKDFLSFTVDWFDAKIPKLNSLWLKGEATAGKSYLMSVFAAVSLNPGYIRAITRYNTFGLMDLVSKSIGIFDECAYTSDFSETLKLLLSGTACPVSVKYQGDSVLPRTPILLASNREDVFDLSMDVWNSRIRAYTWKYCPMLKDINKQCHPLAYYDLLFQYNISF